jgi:hypothetical protein
MTHPQRRYDGRMPRIPDQWLDAVVYLYPSVEAANRGERTGATGFIVSVPPEDPDDIIKKDLGHHYIVTNAHAVENQQLVVARINTRDGDYDVLSIPRQEWQCHPHGDDVAAAVLDVEWKRHRYASVDQSMMLTPELQAHWGFGPGDEVFFIGRYVDHEGQAHNMPTVRSGIISAIPTEPINQPLRRHEQESILVEARSLSGYSGSPVFVTPSAHVERSEEHDGAPTIIAVTGGPCYLLGIDWGHHSWTEKVRDPKSHKPVQDGTYVRGNSGMMMIVPTSKLISLLNIDSFKTMRQEYEKRKIKEILESPNIMDSIDSRDEFDNFEDLTKKLMQVPKSEIDEKRKK